MATSRVASGSGLAFLLQPHGSIARIECGDITLNAYLATELEGGPANIYLRRLDGGVRFVPLLGPASPATSFDFAPGRMTAQGSWEGIEFQLDLVLAAEREAWFWHVHLCNTETAERRVDLVYVQDLVLAHYGAIRNNEYYVSQYVDFLPLEHPNHGATLAIRQNLPMGGRNPWALVGALGRAESFATDGLDVYASLRRSVARPAALDAERLVGRRRQHEHAMAALQHEALTLAPALPVSTGFFATFVADHQGPSSPTDLALVNTTLGFAEASPPASSSNAAAEGADRGNLFSREPLECDELSEAELAHIFGPRREEEYDGGTLLSFFAGSDRHVVLPAKERAVLRPHGHILRSGAALIPDEAALSSTVWMRGVFNSLLTQGHVSINRFISATHGYLGLARADGQRIFVDIDGEQRLLELPSAFEISPSRCRWIYKHGARLIEVETTAGLHQHAISLALRVLAGPPLGCLVSTRVALDGDDGALCGPALVTQDASGITVKPRADTDIGRRFPQGSFRIEPERDTTFAKVGGDELLYADGRSRGEPFVVIATAPAGAIAFRVCGRLLDTPCATITGAHAQATSHDEYWRTVAGSLTLRAPEGSPLGRDLGRLGELLPWLSHNALIHYLAPHGLEQYSGGGWGTRDVCQGPVELLLALGEHAAIRDLLLRVFAAQNPDGDWPQWFMFFERERGIRAPDSHGDIVFWPLLALAEYLIATEDASLLDEPLPFFDARGDANAEHAPLQAHVERALTLISERRVAGTRLAAYGNGDWNDSLQPANPALKEKLASTWTVALNYHLLKTMARALGVLGRDAQALEHDAGQVREEFRRLCIADGVLAGFVHCESGRVTPLLHPRDTITGISYRLLPMIHAMLYDLFTPEEAARHLAIIRTQLLAPDGARLFDRPPRYGGGPTRYFQRAESSSFFGREIGIMYMHAHLRYAEAMARIGEPDAMFLALRQANPIALGETVPNAARRQANCYVSSSDAAFADRYEAEARYGDVKSGKVAVEAGWRIYSSGAGIALRLIHERFLGLERRRSALIIDPVIPVALDGMEADVTLAERRITVRYRTGSRGFGPTRVVLNGSALAFEREDNPYRSGGAKVAMEALAAGLRDGDNMLEVTLS